MKIFTYILSFLLTASVAFAQNNDDVYYQPGTSTVQHRDYQQQYNADPASTPARAASSPNSSNSKTYGSDPNAYNQRTDYRQDSSARYTDSTGNVTNNYYSTGNEDNYDYYYTSRVNRWYRPVTGFGYYGGCYVDRYWYDSDPYYYGSSIYYGSNWFGPSWTWGYCSTWGWPSYGYGFGYGWGYPYYSNYGWGGYYGYGYGHHGYYNGYGYNHGYYDGYYNNGYGSNYSYNAPHYGPRSSGYRGNNAGTNVNTGKRSATSIYGAGKSATESGNLTSRYPGNLTASNIKSMNNAASINRTTSGTIGNVRTAPVNGNVATARPTPNNVNVMPNHGAMINRNNNVSTATIQQSGRSINAGNVNTYSNRGIYSMPNNTNTSRTTALPGRISPNTNTQSSYQSRTSNAYDRNNTAVDRSNSANTYSSPNRGNVQSAPSNRSNNTGRVYNDVRRYPSNSAPRSIERNQGSSQPRQERSSAPSSPRSNGGSYSAPRSNGGGYSSPRSSGGGGYSAPHSSGGGSSSHGSGGGGGHGRR